MTRITCDRPAIAAVKGENRSMGAAVRATGVGLNSQPTYLSTCAGARRLSRAGIARSKEINIIPARAMNGEFDRLDPYTPASVLVARGGKSAEKKGGKESRARKQVKWVTRVEKPRGGKQRVVARRSPFEVRKNRVPASTGFTEAGVKDRGPVG